MRKYLLFALLLWGIIASAQDSLNNYNCKAFFKHEVNTQIMTYAPATAINFYDKSQGNVTNGCWDFGDGNTSTEQNPMFIFNHPIFDHPMGLKTNPYRTVTLTVVTSDSCKSFYSETINIMDGNTYEQPNNSCRAGFKYYLISMDSLNNTATFHLTNLSEGDSLAYFWHFDDNITSTEKEPEITFDLSRSERKVCLTVTSANGCSDMFCDAVYILNTGGGSTEPYDTIKNDCLVEFGFKINRSTETFAPAVVLDFYAKADGEVVRWNWDFGDGTTSEEKNPTHIFNYLQSNDSLEIPVYPYRTVCVSILTASGCETSYCQQINIYDYIEPEEPSCSAHFKYYIPTDLVTIPEVVPYQFVNGSVGDIIKYTWHFEDGTTSNEAEPLVMFDTFKPTQKVHLEITTSDGCTSSWSETINVSSVIVDPDYTDSLCNYKFRYISYYPEWASACVGTATVQVYLNDSLVKPDYIYWSYGVEGPDAKGLCPTRTYTVTAKTDDGCKFSSSFVFNSNGTATENPINWWINIKDNDSCFRYNINNNDYTAEWVLCDGTVITCDSIPMNHGNCDGNNMANLIMKDAEGNIVYSEMVALGDDLTSNSEKVTPYKMMFYPVPVVDVLHVQQNFKLTEAIQFEISDISGRILLKQNIGKMHSGQVFDVNVSSLRSGIYFGKIIANGQVVAIEKFSK